MKGISYVIATILMLVIAIALGGMAYMYIAGFFTGTIQGIEVVYADCLRGEVSITIKNIGTNSISSLTIKQTSPSDDILTASFQGVIEPGRTIVYKDVCEGEKLRSCIYRISPPVGRTVQAIATCTEKPDSLILSLHFDEGTGDIAKDSSLNGNDGTLNNFDLAAAWVDGKFGKALEFDGVDDYIQIPYSPSLNPQDMTIELWVYILSDPDCDGNNNWRWLISRDGWNTYHIILEEWNNIAIGWSVRIGGTLYRLWEPMQPTKEIGRWVHFTAVYDSSTGKMRVYRDGILQNQRDVPVGGIDSDTQGLRIGWSSVACPAGSGDPNAIIDEVRIYNKVII